MTPIVPFTPPHAPKPEPEAILRFGDIEVRLGLTYLHHLRNCQGWGDRHVNNQYIPADVAMSDAMRDIERAMWASMDKPPEPPRVVVIGPGSQAETFTVKGPVAENILKQLAELDKEAEEGIDDPVWLYERTARLVKEACTRLHEEVP